MAPDSSESRDTPDNVFTSLRESDVLTMNEQMVFKTPGTESSIQRLHKQYTLLCKALQIYALLQAGLLEDEVQGGDSPGLPAGRPNVSHHQLETMLSMHGLRDEASDD